MVSEAQRMINEAVNVDKKPFYLHFSTTLTHNPSALDALSDFTSTDSPKGTLTGSEVPTNTGMKSRATVLSEVDALGISNGNQRETAAGTIWLDDAIGALLRYLKDPSVDQYDNTFIVITILFKECIHISSPTTSNQIDSKNWYCIHSLNNLGDNGRSWRWFAIF